MLTVLKSNGATSKAGDKVKRGGKGHLRLFAYSDGNGRFGVSFADVGNYGKERWNADFGMLSREDIAAMASDLMSLANGEFDSTEIPFDEVLGANEPTDVPEAEAVEAERNETDEVDEVETVSEDGLTDSERVFVQEAMKEGQIREI